jgi:hypothetical protein
MPPNGHSDLIASKSGSSRLADRLRDPRPWRIAAFVLLVLGIVAGAVAWHYRTQAKRLSAHGAARPVSAATPGTLPPPLQVHMTTAEVALRAGRIRGEIKFTITTDPTARLAHGQVAVSRRFSTVSHQQDMSPCEAAVVTDRLPRAHGRTANPTLLASSSSRGRLSGSPPRATTTLS